MLFIVKCVNTSTSSSNRVGVTLSLGVLLTIPVFRCPFPTRCLYRPAWLVRYSLCHHWSSEERNGRSKNRNIRKPATSSTLGNISKLRPANLSHPKSTAGVRRMQPSWRFTDFVKTLDLIFRLCHTFGGKGLNSTK